MKSCIKSLMSRFGPEGPVIVDDPMNGSESLEYKQKDFFPVGASLTSKSDDGLETKDEGSNGFD